jgi:7-carboxy-7-deazaguanine synthase
MTNKIKVSEIFFTIQGEGRYMGVPSVFLRTFGCNFRCYNYGRPVKSSLPNEEVAAIIEQIDSFSQYKDLPLVTTGCDSYPAVYPAFKHLSPLMSTTEIVDRFIDILPNHAWNDVHLVITGGEPLLGWQRAYPALLSDHRMSSLKELTFETNGTQLLTPEFTEYLETWKGYRLGRDSITFSVSAKLSDSGENYVDAIKPEVVCSYEKIGYTYLKFVVATEDDVNEALLAIADYRNDGFTGPVYLMPIGGIESVYSLNNRRVAELAMKHGLRYSDRLQVPLFKNGWAT